MNSKTKKLTMLAMLCALAYAAVALLRIPVVLFLKYEPKDVVLTIGGFLFGPLASFCMSALVSLVEMLTLSDTGLIGFAMNLLASCSFACTAAWIYKKHHTLKGAVLGLCKRDGRYDRPHDPVELPDYANLHGIPPGSRRRAAAARLFAVQPAEGWTQYRTYATYL